MCALTDAFVAISGGLGTLDETRETVAWGPLGLHARPILPCDVGGRAAPLR
jgi:predicted Rossmann-fold nucleotide-binding protein